MFVHFICLWTENNCLACHLRTLSLNIVQIVRLYGYDYEIIVQLLWDMNVILVCGYIASWAARFLRGRSFIRNVPKPVARPWNGERVKAFILQIVFG